MKKKKYATGGELIDTIGQLAPLLNLIPGVGQAAAPLVGMGAKFLGQQANKGINDMPTNYKNSNAFGYADGGSLAQLAQGTYQVIGAPNQTDGNNINYKGQPIALDHGETLDTNKDRVISDKYFNPLTGKKFSDEDKSLKRMRSKSEKINALSSDPAARNTAKIASKMEDDIFNKQETIATILGDRDNQNTTDMTMPKKGFEDGGTVQPIDSREQLMQQMAQMVRNMNQPKPLETSVRPELFPEDVNYEVNPDSQATSYGGGVIPVQPKAQKSNTSNVELQKKLISLGYDNIGKAGIKGSTDGVIGNRTKAAIRQAIASGKLDESYNKYITGKSASQSGVQPMTADSIINRRKQATSNYGYNKLSPAAYNPKNANTGLDQNGIAYDTDKSESVYQLSDNTIVYKAPEYDGTGKSKVIKYLIPKGDGTYSSFKSLEDVKHFDKVRTGVYNKLDQQDKNNQERFNYINSDLTVHDKNINNYQSQLNETNQKLSDTQRKQAEITNSINAKKILGVGNFNASATTQGDFNRYYSDERFKQSANSANVLDARIRAQIKKADAIEEGNRNAKAMDAKRKGTQKLMTGGMIKHYDGGGYLDPLQPLIGNPIQPVQSTGDWRLNTLPLKQLALNNLSTANRPDLSNVSSLVSQVNANKPTSVSNQSHNMWSDFTTGEKIGLGADALSVGLKAIESFRPAQKEPYRYNNAPISLNALDPAHVLNNNQASYTSALNDLNNSSSTGSNRAALANNLFSNRLKADNDVLSKYGEMNANQANQYEQRLGQRNSENNSMAYQVDDLNSRNRGAAANMRMGVYGDLSTLGLNTSTVVNNRMSQEAALAALKKMAPDVYTNLMKTMDANLQKITGGK